MNSQELDRFNRKIAHAVNGCHVWTGARIPEGYGHFSIGGRAQGAHRVAYEHYIGPIPTGAVIDHLCRNRACVNPDHLEAVTSRENTVRGIGPTAERANMTHCIRGHELVGDNLYVKPNGNRVCRTCKNERQRDARAKKGLS